MTGTDPAALRELAQGLTVPTIAEAETGTSVADREDDTWTALDDGWYCPGYEELSTDELEDRGVSITHVPLSVEQLAAVRAALEGAAAGLDQARAERDGLAGQVAALTVHLAASLGVDPHPDGIALCGSVDPAAALGAAVACTLSVLAERDRARNIAAALEAENAILRPAVDEVTRARADAARATGPDPWKRAAALREALETIRAHGPCGRCDADEVAGAALDADEPEGGEDRD